MCFLCRKTKKQEDRQQVENEQEKSRKKEKKLSFLLLLGRKGGKVGCSSPMGAVLSQLFGEEVMPGLEGGDFVDICLYQVWVCGLVEAGVGVFQKRLGGFDGINQGNPCHGFLLCLLFCSFSWEFLRFSLACPLFLGGIKG